MMLTNILGPFQIKIAEAFPGFNGRDRRFKKGMLYPEVFSSVYATAPATLNWSDGINTSLDAFKIISDAKSDSDIFKNNVATIMVDLARTYSPDWNRMSQSTKKNVIKKTVCSIVVFLYYCVL